LKPTPHGIGLGNPRRRQAVLGSVAERENCRNAPLQEGEERKMAYMAAREKKLRSGVG